MHGRQCLEQQGHISSILAGSEGDFKCGPSSLLWQMDGNPELSQRHQDEKDATLKSE